MAGLYGLIGDADRQLLSAMGSRLAHRGGTTGEWEAQPRVLLGERVHAGAIGRLATGSLAMVADAEIYNAAELREKIRARGRPFHTERDEEVILQGYAEFGPDIFAQVVGDFAVALWDGDRAALVLARDQLGSRPLYYWVGEGRFAFASEYKALLALPFVPAVADRDAIQELQHTKFAPLNRTLLRDIRHVAAGHVAEYRDGEYRERRYWQVAVDVIPADEGWHAGKVREALLAAVARQLRGLTVAGAELSGGIDSTAIAAAIRHSEPDLPLHTFTCGYGPEDPEIQVAAATAQTLGTQHHELFLRPEDMPGVLPELVWHLEDPIARSETLLAYETARAAAPHVDVVFCGHGADSLFAGMPKYKILKLIEAFPLLRTPLAEFYAYTQFSAPPRSVAGRLLQAAYYRGKAAPPPTVLEAAKPSGLLSLPSETVELLNHVARPAIQDGVSKWAAKAERTHIAHGVRLRSPFLDVDVVRTAFQVPDRYKIRGWREKHILRQAMRPLLPPAMLNRPKFPQAVNYDLAFSRVVEELVDAVLSPQAIRSRGLFLVGDIDRLRRRPSGRPYSSERAMRLWTAVLTELWAQIFLDARGDRQGLAHLDGHLAGNGRRRGSEAGPSFALPNARAGR